MDKRDASTPAPQPLPILAVPIRVFADDGKWYDILPQMIRTWVINGETDMLAEVTVVYQADYDKPDQLAFVVASGANGKLLARAIRATQPVQANNTPAPAANPPGYGFRRFCDTDDREGNTSVFDSLIEPELTVGNIRDMKNFITILCCTLNMRVTFEWVANPNPDDQSLVADMSYNWSKSTASPE